jgi:archaellum biogenesis ATPase FlaH
MFSSAGKNSHLERAARADVAKNQLRFGIDFLDDACSGILQDDLVLLGAPSGVGKTQLCCNIAYANLEDGKRVHYIALEASHYEIERRLKYPLVLERFLADPNRPKLERRITFTDWLLSKHIEALAPYEDAVDKYFETAFRDLNILYKPERFGVTELIESVMLCSADTDLIIIDHVHYFDLDDDNENRGIKLIAKTVRTLALEEMKPIILVAHLRKRDKHNEELVPGLDEFHGSSDLYKIATKVVTFSPGKPTPEGNYETFFRIPKNRLDGGVSRFIGREFFNPRKGSYEKGKYQLGWAGQTRKAGFGEIEPSARPSWLRRDGTGFGCSHPVPSGQQRVYASPGGPSAS